MSQQWNSFHPFGYAINDRKNIIETVTVLQGAHQIHMQVRKNTVGMGWGTRRVWQWILPCWQASHWQVQAVMSLDSPHHPNLNEII
jgi:hypothetical protein